jgi:DNA-binding protein HU-beta
MNKGDLIRELAKVAGTKKEAGAAVNTILETITKALKKGNKVTLIGFGTYSVTKRAGHDKIVFPVIGDMGGQTATL